MCAKELAATLTSRDVFKRADVVAFGEHHPDRGYRTQFDQLMFEALALDGNFRSVAVEISVESYVDFMKFVTDVTSLDDYKANWVKPDTHTSCIPDSFFSGLKSLSKAGLHLVFVYTKDDRDLFMAGEIKRAVQEHGRCITWLGAAHCIKRKDREEILDWQSAIEHLSVSMQTHSIVEISRRDILTRDRDCSLEKLLNTDSSTRLMFEENYGGRSEMVLYKTRIDRQAPEYTPQQLLMKLKHYDAAFIDGTRYLTAEEEKERRPSGSVDYSNVPTLRKMGWISSSPSAKPEETRSD